jgi:D-3-phosphoglycerate dehydrogenase / 2-oxoglutarate reductase
MMFRIQTLNRISSKGLDAFPRERYEVASEIPTPDAILVRSADMTSHELASSLKVIARAGAGVNNIPVERCTARGIVVLNTPGANANAVKELVLAALFLSSRRIVEGLRWVDSLKQKGDEVPRLVESGKSAYDGPEIRGKTLGVIGLGAIGVLVANDAVALGMNVVGYDPFISVESAWGLSREVRRAKVLDALIAESDYITLHVPLAENTRGMINRTRFALMRKGVRLLNLARGGLVNNADAIQAIGSGTLACYVTDFPDSDLVGVDRVIAIPHLGASTPESEENCAVMAVRQTIEFLESGNVRNSVNFPDCEMGPVGTESRLLIANRNIPNMVGQVTTLLAAEGINISDLLNRHKGDIAYNIINIDGTPQPSTMARILAIEGVIMARLLRRES